MTGVNSAGGERAMKGKGLAEERKPMRGRHALLLVVLAMVAAVLVMMLRARQAAGTVEFPAVTAALPAQPI